MKIIAFSSSLNPESSSLKGLKVAAEAARQEGVEVELYDLRERPLPIYYSEGAEQDANVQAFIKAFNEADGFILASPEYHNGPSGAFKNALDFVGFNQFAGKPIGLVSASGGPVATNTLNQMMTILRSLHGYVVPQFGAVPGGTVFTAEGQFADAKMQERFEAIGKSVAKLAKAIRG